jgi:hypothetical protein
MTGPSGPSFPVTDTVFKVINSVTSSDSVMFNLNGQTANIDVKLCFTGGVGSTTPNLFLPVPAAQDTVVYETFTGTIYNKFYAGPLLIHPRGYSNPAPTAVTSAAFPAATLSTASSDSAGVIITDIGGVPAGVNALVVNYGTAYSSPPASVVVSVLLTTWQIYMNTFSVVPNWGANSFGINCDLTGFPLVGAVPLFSYMVM